MIHTVALILIYTWYRMRTTKTTADAQKSLCDLTFEEKEEGEICEFMDH